MSSYSSYKDLLKRKKEVKLQRTYLWHEISALHQIDEKKGTSYWVQRILTIDPSTAIQTWKLAVRIGSFFSRSSKKTEQ